MNKVAVVYSSYYTDVIKGLLEGIKNTREKLSWERDDKIFSNSLSVFGKNP